MEKFYSSKALLKIASEGMHPPQPFPWIRLLVYTSSDVLFSTENIG